VMEWKLFPYRHAAGFLFPFVENPFSLSLRPPHCAQSNSQ